MQITEEHFKEVVAENERLRAALALSERPCVYCSLPAEEWNKCQSGFPGCSRADDSLGCPYLGDSFGLEVQVKELEEQIQELKNENARLRG